MKNIDDLYTKPDHQGDTLYYIDENLAIPFTGHIVESIKDKLIWEFDVVDGEQEGIERTYHNNGQLKQIVEYKNNLQYGVSKDFDEDGNLIYVSVVWNNDYIKILFIENGDITVKENKSENLLHIPHEIQNLLNLNNKELIAYQFDDSSK